MKDLKVLILEDSPDEATFLESLLRKLGCTDLRITNTLEHAVAAYTEDIPDICIIDIYLGDKPEGILFAEEINTQQQKRPFVFLTSATDTTTFRLAKLTTPYSYLLKPYNPLELQYAIELALTRFRQETAPPEAPAATAPADDTLFIKKGNLLQRIRIDDIIYIEVDGKYSKVVCHSEKFVIQQSLKDLQGQLPSAQFSRVHRNYIVNLKEVTRINTFNNEIFLKDGSSLFFSRRYIDVFLQAFKIFR
ncbi:LytR/AlgR family response regulator transcription factor [Chitinophaga tropicalis]|uniref:Response regulator n=1 Tax=Chitinophaga tropicalis TaxID=2683588 RepID=A0A7K1U3A5_9BACT|nr:response regulator transcription factor [Chitinophaga tropicalis]MVT08485.1 response regulator [Chitinophaga tropicalis]